MIEPIRILVVSNLFPPHVLGGAEIVAHRQALRLRARGHDVCVFAGWIAPDDRKGDLAVEDVDGLRVYRVPVASFEPDGNFRNGHVDARLTSVLNAERPDVVHFHNVAGLGFSLVRTAHRLGFKTIVTLHDHSGYCFRATVLREDGSICGNTEECGTACLGAIEPRDVGRALPMRLRRDYVAWALGHADRLVSPSTYLADAYVRSGVIDAERVTVISNGIDLAAFETSQPHLGDAEHTTVRFLCAAYLGPHKGLPDLLRAAEILASDKSLAGAWSLCIAGDGFLRPAIEAEIATGKFAGAVSAIGRVPRDRIITELTAAHVVVLPSRWPENEPVILLEAAAAGRAQLATDVGGVNAIVHAGITGELTPPSDPASLAAAMQSYVREPGKALRQGRANHARRDELSEATSIDRLETLYRDVLDSPPIQASRVSVVVCAGDWPLQEVATTCNYLHSVEARPGQVRLIWHAWIERDVWHDATWLWNWSSGAQHVEIQAALTCGLRILAPSDCRVAAGLEASFDVATTYGTHLECLALLAQARPTGPTGPAQAMRSSLAAEVVAATAPSARYALVTPDLAA